MNYRTFISKFLHLNKEVDELRKLTDELLKAEIFTCHDCNKKIAIKDCIFYSHYDQLQTEEDDFIILCEPCFKKREI